MCEQFYNIALVAIGFIGGIGTLCIYLAIRKED